MIRLGDILDEIHLYNPGADVDLINKAYVFSAKVHQGQKRRSGEPYLTHPLEVANILAKMHLDAPSIATGLLHDTVEDTLVTLDEIKGIFGEKIARLVDGVTKLSKINFLSKEQRQAENFRKMFMAMAEDIRVILVKLADRLHNMRTLSYMSESKQMVIAQETLDIYAPIAGRLGIQEIRTELENLCLYYLKPEVWKTLHKKVEDLEKKSEGLIREVSENLGGKMEESGLKPDLSGRIKHLYSVYRKMEQQNIEFEQIYDLLAVRVLVQTIPQCYETLGIIHSLWKPVPGRFKDYIGMPKINNYQSLHTTVAGPKGDKIEFQIRTREMHETSEWGIASHWKYKEGGEIDTKDELKFRWIRKFLEWQKELSDPAEYLDTVKLDLFSADIYVFTPKGDIREFPYGSTPVDFAYAVHTEVGNHCVGARINGKMVPLRHLLKSGDTVEVLTHPNHQPSKDWLKFVVTSRAKAKIRQFIREEGRERGLSFGRELLVKEFQRYGVDLGKVAKGELMTHFIQEKGHKTLEQLYTMVGFGRVSPQQVVAAVLPPEKLSIPSPFQPGQESAIKRIFKKAFERSKGLINVDGYEDVLITMGKCCNPLPGDSIIGFITRGRGITVHMKDCGKILATDQARRVEVKWSAKGNEPIPTKIRIVCVDKPGLLADISKTISMQGVNISQATCRGIGDEKSLNSFEVGIQDLKQLHGLIKSIEKVKGVISVERVRD